MLSYLLLLTSADVLGALRVPCIRTPVETAAATEQLPQRRLCVPVLTLAADCVFPDQGGHCPSCHNSSTNEVGVSNRLLPW
jgi:hypothetical protein